VEVPVGIFFGVDCLGPKFALRIKELNSPFATVRENGAALFDWFCFTHSSPKQICLEK
jgi:hypothetical protein